MKYLSAKRFATCYLASGWFNEAEEKARQEILKVLNDNGVSYFSPKDEVEVKPNATQEEQKAAFKADVEFIEGCDFIIASTVGKDLGSIFEIGYAYAKGVPIITYFPNDKNLPVNLMLAQSSVAVATSAEQLNDIVAKLVENRFDFDKIRETFEGAVE